MIDDRTTELKRATVEAFAMPIPVLVDMMTERFPVEKERKEFGAKVEAEMRNPAYHLYTHGYASLFYRLIKTPDISRSDVNRKKVIMVKQDARAARL